MKNKKMFIKWKGLLFTILWVISLGMFAQNITVRGTVTDENNEPVIGATVLVKGTSMGTVTDVKGNYTLDNVPINGTLEFSYVGMKTKVVNVNGKTTINVVMEEDVIGLEEVVAIGYGTMRRSDLTGAVATANMKALENSPNVNILQSIKGVVPGLNVGVATTAGGDPDISIRGRNTISGTTNPLIVLDGIIYRGSLTDINPNDVESIDVLKDASSTAIYGSQGANGVLIITTKKAKGVIKPVIEYSGKYASQSLINQNMKRLDREGYLNQLADVYISRSRMGEDLLTPNPNFDVSTLLRDESAIAGYINGTDVDWWKLLSYSHPYIQDHNISLRGRSEQSNYFLSFGYSDQKNMVKNDTYKRYNIRVNLEAEVAKWLKVGTQSFFNISDFSGTNVGFSNLCYIPALVSPYNEDGSLKTRPYLGNVNPLLIVDNPNENVRQTLSGNFYADITIPWLDGLNYRINYTDYMITYKNYNFNPYANSDLGSSNKYTANQNEWIFDNILTYKNKFGLHDISATFVYGVEERNYENTNAAARNFTNKTLGYNKLQAGQPDLNTVSSDAWKETSLYSMLRGIYTYKNRYIFTGTVRRDGFSGFGEKHKFGIFPSGAVAWRMSEENFIKNNFDWIDNLKLRFSYGESGNRTIGRYSTQAKMTSNLPSGRTGGYLYGDGASAELVQAISTMANENLKWETTSSSNFGIDFSFFKGRLFGNYDFYVSHTKDLLYNINVPSVNGTFKTSIPTNIGELKNVGHELSVSGVPVKKQDFQWDITFNIATNRNKVITILGIDADGDGREDDIISSNIFIGEPLGTIYDYNIIGMWQIADYNAGIIPNGFYYGTYKIEDLNEDGNYTAENDRKILGYSDPLYNFSIHNVLRYKDFELKAIIYAVQGGKNHYLGQPAGDLPIPDHLTNNSYFKFDYWTPENPDAKYRQLGAYTPALGPGFSPYVSRSFIRLQELSIAYNFPSSLLKRINVNRLKVYVSGTNLFTITDWDGWDPEANQGLTYELAGGYPTMKGFTVGLNFEF